MNIILLRSADWIDAESVRLTDRRHEHLQRVLRAQPGDTVRVGALNGRRGHAVLVEADEHGSLLRVQLTKAALPRHPFTVVLALPRPKMLRRVLRTCAEFGVAELHLIHTHRVEKSFWQSPLLQPERINDALQAGLERSGDTLLPAVYQHRRFRPFAEDTLPGIAASAPLFCLHPGDHGNLDCDRGTPCTVMIGPEGGFIPFEIALLQANGAQLRALGTRILSVDTAINGALGRELSP